MEKMIDNDNIYIKDKRIDKTKQSIQLCISQLSDKKKTNMGFNITDSVIDVDQGGYGITNRDDILYTYGIEPCCAIVVFDETKRSLFHLDGTSKPDTVLDIINNFDFESNSRIIVIPGITCGIEGSFKYKELEKKSEEKGYSVEEYRIPNTLGYVTVKKDSIIFGTAINRDYETVINISNQKTQKK